MQQVVVETSSHMCLPNITRMKPRKERCVPLCPFISLSAFIRLLRPVCKLGLLLFLDSVSCCCSWCVCGFWCSYWWCPVQFRRGKQKYSFLRHATETMDKRRCDGSFGLYAAFTRSFTKGCNSLHLLWLNILDFPLMLWMKLPIVYRIHLQSNQFPMGVANKATGD